MYLKSKYIYLNVPKCIKINYLGHSMCILPKLMKVGLYQRWQGHELFQPQQGHNFGQRPENYQKLGKLIFFKHIGRNPRFDRERHLADIQLSKHWRHSADIGGQLGRHCTEVRFASFLSGGLTKGQIISKKTNEKIWLVTTGYLIAKREK